MNDDDVPTGGGRMKEPWTDPDPQPGDFDDDLAGIDPSCVEAHAGGSEPAEVTVTLPWDEARALADHPAKLQPDDPGLFWVGKVKRACQKLTEAMQAATAPKPADAPTAVEDPGRRSSGPEIPPAGALEPGDDVTVLPDEELPEALKRARQARVARDPLNVVTPSKLYRLAIEEHDVGDEATKLYRHAMIEAGYMVPKAAGEPNPPMALEVGFEPCDPCPICNWSPTK